MGKRKESMRQNIAVKNSANCCFKCLGTFPYNELNIIEIPSAGYGSRFDGFASKLNLCHDCLRQTDPSWWQFKVIKSPDGYSERFEHEQEILDFIDSMPIAGHELFYNRYSCGALFPYMEPQDWIDYKLSILPLDKQKKYGLYTIDATNAKATINKENEEVIKFIYNKNESDNLIIGGQIITEALIELIKKDRGL